MIGRFQLKAGDKVVVDSDVWHQLFMTCYRAGAKFYPPLPADQWSLQIETDQGWIDVPKPDWMSQE